MGTFRDGEKQQDRETGRALRCSMTCLRDDAEWAGGEDRSMEEGLSWSRWGMLLVSK